MQARFLAILYVSLLYAAPAQSADELPIDRGIGQPLSISALRQTDVLTEKQLTLADVRGKRAMVLFFTGTDCPVGNLYMPRIVELAKTFGERGILFVLVNSNASETKEKVRDHAKSFGVTFPVIKDQDGVLADLALADRTCEAVMVDLTFTLVPKPSFDRLGKIIYRGAIDDQYVRGARKPEPTQPYLAHALEEFLANQPITLQATHVEGCPIERSAPSKVLKVAGTRIRPLSEQLMKDYQARDQGQTVVVGTVTYADHVAPILQNKCQSCHRPGQVGPFSLLSFDDAKRWSTSIAEVVETRRMPPWHPSPRFGHFANDRSLTAQERATLMAWVDQDCPTGDLGKQPPAKTFADGWTIGKPDAVIEMPITYTVPRQGWVDYVRLRVPAPFAEEKWLQAIEAKPTAKAVVHHIIVYMIPPDNSRPMYVVGYAPGDLAEVYPPGTAKRIPAGSELLFELHYTPNGQSYQDRSSVAMIFADPKSVTREAMTVPISSQDFERRRVFIPPGDANFPVTSARSFNDDGVELLGLMPHMHLRGKAFRYNVTYPDGKTDTLLDVPAYDYSWQSFYWLTQPISLAKGTKINCTGWFDNSSSNPANPDPNSKVYWGDQTFEEMMIGFIEITRPRRDARSNAAAANSAPQSKNNSTASVLGRLLGRALGDRTSDPAKAQEPGQSPAPSSNPR